MMYINANSERNGRCSAQSPYLHGINCLLHIAAATARSPPRPHRHLLSLLEGEFKGRVDKAELGHIGHLLAEHLVYACVECAYDVERTRDVAEPYSTQRDSQTCKIVIRRGRNLSVVMPIPVFFARISRHSVYCREGRGSAASS